MTQNPRSARCGIVLALTLGLAAASAAQAPKAGEVSRVEGTAAVARVALAAATPLKVKDDVFARDLITTGLQSKAQLLLGGKALVTMREQSSLRISEQPPVSTLELADGVLKLKVVKDRMKPGERVDVKTPNAITAVRGTTIVLEVSTTPSGPSTRLTVLEGFVDITPLDPVTGAPRGAPVRVNDLQQTTVSGPGSAPAPPQPLNQSDATRLDATFAFKLSPTAASDDLLKRQLEQAASDAAKIRSGARLPTDEGAPVVSGDDIRSRAGVPLPPPPASTGSRGISPSGR